MASWASRFKKNLPPPDILSLKIIATAPDDAKHQNDVMALLYHKDTLITGADDGKIKVTHSQTLLLTVTLLNCLDGTSFN
jgi:hypothetical protein